MTPAEKVRLARQFDRLGVDIIEAGFPISSDGDSPGRRGDGCATRPVIAGLARATTADIDRACSARRGRPARGFTSSSPPPTSTSRTSSASIARPAWPGRPCRPLRPRARRRTSSSRRRTPPAATWKFLCDVAAAAVEAGATTIGLLPDTVGYALPADITHMFARVRARVGDARHAVGALPRRLWAWRSRTRSRRLRPGAAGGVHHQRHRRAGRQCLAGRSRYGAHVRREPMPYAPASHDQRL